MADWSRFIDLELSDDEKLDMTMPIRADAPQYPPGLRISLCEEVLQKLGLDEPPDVGDILDLRAFACVTSYSNDGSGRRVELQIERLAVENETTEDDDE